MAIYLDHNATTPIREEVCNLLDKCNRGTYGNPSSPYQIARKSREKLEFSRERIANLIGCSTQEIIFTSGGTESNNLAIQGVLGSGKGHAISTQIEHLSVLGVFRKVEREKEFRVTYLPVDSNGFVSLDDFKDSIREDTVFVSIMLANNEIGSVQRIKEMVKVAKKENKGIIFHTDAVQGLGKLEIDAKDMGVDLMSLSSHKIYGPKGVGALYIKKGTRIAPLFSGGHQEKKIRPGTENLPSIIGFGLAGELVKENMDGNIKKLRRIRDLLKDNLVKNLEGIVEIKINSPSARCLPNTLNVSFRGIDSELLISYLSKDEIFVSSGSACTTGSLEPSHVLMAMGLRPGLAKSAIRFSIGLDNSREEMEIVAAKVREIILTKLENNAS